MKKDKTPGLSRGLIFLMFLGLYATWSTTYLAIAYMVETIPPYLSSGLRFIAAGGLLYIFAATRPDAPKTSRLQWRDAFITGGLVVMLGNGNVVWGEQFIPSSLAALLVATVPLWIVVLNWLLFRAARPTLAEAAGVILGFSGVALLIGFTKTSASEAFHPFGIAIVLFAAVSWATGSLYSRHAHTPSSPLLAVSLQMLAGGALLTVASVLTGEVFRFNPSAVSTASILAWAYLVVFGSLVGFVCYMILMRNCRPSRVATYAYVNPVGAVFLGWLVAGDPLTVQTLFAAGTIIAAVFLIISFAPKS
ncbi:MAG: EamA family transporter [Thermovirgaceae bacterium]